jgi:segregation and condensation protein A
MTQPPLQSFPASADAQSALADAAFVVELESFSGPLDLLLHLIREQEIDIADIPIARIADQFLQVIEELGLNQAAEYLEMAARLLRIKIQMLLPRSADGDEWEDPRAELVRRLLEYEQIREVAQWLVERASDRAARFHRGWVPEPAERPPPEVVIDLDSILEAAERVVEGMPQPIIHRAVPRPLDVEGATRRIEALLVEHDRIDFRLIVGERAHVADIISALIAVLEMARLGKIALIQTRPFGSFTVANESADRTA